MKSAGPGTEPRPELTGSQAFALHDTYGFPIDLTLEMAAEQGVAVDEAGFRRLMQEQKDRARADAKARKQGHVDTSVYRRIADGLGRAVEFTGYDEVVSEGRVAGIVRDGEKVEAAGPGDDIELVLDRTPFYAEGGGQLADGGRIELDNGAVIEVRDVQSPIGGVITHRATVVARRGRPGRAGPVRGRHRAPQVDLPRPHGDAHGAQGDSRGARRHRDPGGFGERAGPLPVRLQRPVGGAASRCCATSRPRSTRCCSTTCRSRAEVMTQQQARDAGAMALFGEKYGDAVRVISVGDWARELCGGTHAQRSGQLGVVKLLGESSIGSGVRRVEALVGADAYSFLAREHAIVGQLTEALQARPEELPERVAGILGRLKEAEREIAAARQEKALGGGRRAGVQRPRLRRGRPGDP